LNSFALFTRIGEGGMGEVWEAEDLLGRPFAVKLIHEELASNPSARERFRREAMALSHVRHPNVVPVHHYEEQGNLAWLVMPLLQGETLAARIEREGACRLAELLRIGREAAEGLHAIHAHGLVHRDVKPSNIFVLAPAGEVVVMDFGLAIRKDDARLSSPGFPAGTQGYMSPERLAGRRGEAPADLFSLGVVLWQLATGVSTLFDTRDSTYVPAYLREPESWSLRRPFERRPDLPAAVDALILRMLAWQPNDRPTAREVADALAVL
jgi:serine/threonine protein kinase